LLPRNPAEHCSALQKVFPVNSRLFWGCYCNFNVSFLFICFEIVFCIMDVKKKKEKIIIEKEMCVCLCIFFMYIIEIKRKKNEFNILIYMHKYLKDR
jgi:hypothetical protein